jgi:hypothetical protein
MGPLWRRKLKMRDTSGKLKVESEKLKVESELSWVNTYYVGTNAGYSLR